MSAMSYKLKLVSDQGYVVTNCMKQDPSLECCNHSVRNFAAFYGIQSFNIVHKSPPLVSKQDI